MAGTSLGGKRAARANKDKYGETFYADIGRIGGKLGRTGGLASNKVGADGLTGRERAAIAGTKGGHISRRGGRPSKIVVAERNASLREIISQALRKLAGKAR